MNKSIFIILFVNAFSLFLVNSQVTNIPLVKNLSYKEIKVSEYVSAIKYVPLETKRECLLNEELQIIATSQFIFVHDFLADRVYRFDANSGKFLNTIGKKGQGPGEYQKLFGIYVDDVQKKCYLMDSYANKIYIYYYDGKYVTVYSGPYAPNRMIKIDNNFLLNNLLYTQTKNEMFLIDQNGKVLKKARLPEKKYGLILWPPYFYSHNGQIYYKNYVSDYIYSIDKSLNKKPAYFIDLGKRSINPQENQYSLDKGSIIDDLTIVIGEIKGYKDNIFIPYCTDKRSFAVYNTETKKILSPGKKGESGFIDDLTNGPLVKIPYSSYLFISTLENQLISVIYIPEIENEKFQSGTFKKVMDKLDIDSNPIVRIVTLK